MLFRSFFMDCFIEFSLRILATSPVIGCARKSFKKSENISGVFCGCVYKSALDILAIFNYPMNTLGLPTIIMLSVVYISPIRPAPKPSINTVEDEVVSGDISGPQP